MSSPKPRRERNRTRSEVAASDPGEGMLPGGEASPKRGRKPMPPGREAVPKRERKPMPPGREARPPKAPRVRPAVTLAEPSAGRRIVVAAWVGTALLLVSSVAGAIDPHPLDVVALVAALALFFGGLVAFFAAYVVAIGRSRESDMGIAAVFGLAGSAPRAVQVSLYAALAVEIAVAVSTAAARLHSVLAFGILAVMWGLGMIALWGATHGAFPPRQPNPERGRGRR
jgi:hypothetical protein